MTNIERVGLFAICVVLFIAQLSIILLLLNPRPVLFILAFEAFGCFGALTYTRIFNK
jgi:hypothetical protein